MTAAADQRAGWLALCEAATRGPWHPHSYGHRDVTSQVRSVGRSLRLTNKAFDIGEDFQQTDLTWVHRDPEGESICLTGNGAKRDANAAFIAASREAVPKLIAEVDALQAIVALARAREAASVAVEEHLATGGQAAMFSSEEVAWHRKYNRLTAEQAAAVAALRKALGEVAG